MRSKNKTRVTAVAVLVLVVAVAGILVACSSDNNGSTGGNNTNPSSSATNDSNGNSYNKMFLGWGTVAGGPNDTDVDGQGYCVLDAQLFMEYTKAFPDSWSVVGGSQRVYTGQDLTLVSSGTRNPQQLQFRATEHNDGVFTMILDRMPEITFVAADGQTYNLPYKARVTVYYSPERGVLTPAEYEASK